MDHSSDTDSVCPICKGMIQNPSEPTPCCKKVFCHSCLRLAILTRPECPVCKSLEVNNNDFRFKHIQQSLSLQKLQVNNITTQSVNSNLPGVINQPRDAQAEPSNSGVLIPGPAQDTNHSFGTLPRPPVYTPRTRDPQTCVGEVRPAPAVNFPRAFIFPAVSDNDNIGTAGIRFYKCPYCPEDKLDDLELLAHCNASHPHDTTKVVCPICVSLPHGNSEYYSMDFIGHLNQRHCYYIEDMTNVDQDDETNLQDAILRSLKLQ